MFFINKINKIRRFIYYLFSYHYLLGIPTVVQCDGLDNGEQGNIFGSFRVLYLRIWFSLNILTYNHGLNSMAYLYIKNIWSYLRKTKRRFLVYTNTTQFISCLGYLYNAPTPSPLWNVKTKLTLFVCAGSCF